MHVYMCTLACIYVIPEILHLQFLLLFHINNNACY